MGKLIKFFKHVPKEYAQDAMFRAYGRHRNNHHRLQAENKRKPQQGKQPGEVK
jgi:hypothetical protein